MNENEKAHYLRTVAYDGLHLTPQGNEHLAESLMEPTLEILK